MMSTQLHVAGHLFIGGTTIGPLMGWLFGCVIMFATKKLVTRQGHKSHGACVIQGIGSADVQSTSFSLLLTFLRP